MAAELASTGRARRTMPNVWRYLRLYGAYLRLGFRAGWQEYPGQVVLEVAVTITLDLANLALLWFVLQHFGSMAGWTFWDVALLHAIRDVVWWSYVILAQTGWVEDFIVDGDLDRFLVRPLPVLLQVLADRRQTGTRLPRLAYSLGLLFFAAAQAGIAWTPLKLGMLAVLLAGGVAVRVGLSLALTSVSFWTKRFSHPYALLSAIEDRFLDYPLKIFGPAVQLALTVGLPLAFINYVPASYLLDRTSDLLLTPLLVFAAPLAGGAAVAVAVAVWRRGLRVYESAGT